MAGLWKLRRGAWFAGLPALLLIAGCSFPAMRFRPGTPASRRENLVRFLSNRALMAYYDGRGEEVDDSLDLARELTHDAHRMDQFARGLSDNSARFRLYTDFPGYPEKRIQEGTAFRAAMYPVWGLPFDLIEAPLKAIATIPGVSFAAAYAPMAVGESMMSGAASDDGPDSHAPAKEHHAKPKEQKHSKPEKKKDSGKGQSKDDDHSGDPGARLAEFAIGAALIVAPCVSFYGLNGLQAAVYPADWDERMEGWNECAFWYAPGVLGRERESGRMTSAFFANARRIVVRDKRSYKLFEEVHSFLNSGIPLSVRNERLARLNRALDQLPAGASRSDASEALAAEMRSWEQSASAANR